MAAADYIGATIEGSRNVAVGKEIRLEIENGGDVAEGKLDRMFRMVYETREQGYAIRERVSVLRTWLIALTAFVAALFGWQIFGG